MRQKTFTAVALFLAILMLFPYSGALVQAQIAVPSSSQLDVLLAPVALYPDALLAQITAASTDPQQVLDCENWLRRNSHLQGEALADAAQQQGFDSAFVALVAFPQVLDTMALNIDDYAAIGSAFAANQALVSDSIQRLRTQAYSAGNLQNNSQQLVSTESAGGRQVIVIQSANPQIVYVPQYEPTVYVRQTSILTPLITFGSGIALGYWFTSNAPWGWRGWGWNWGSRNLLLNHNIWVIRHSYRPPRRWYRPRPVPYQNRPGYGGNWGHGHWAHRPGRPGGPRPGGGRPGGTRPPVRPTPRPKPTTRPTPTTRPKPTTTRPTPTTRPGQGAKPATRPAHTKRPAPAKRPASATRPQPAARPAPQPQNPAQAPTPRNKAESIAS